PVIGIGLNTWGFVQERYGWPRSYAATYAIEGGLLFVAVMTGIIGLVVYLWMLWGVWSRARRLGREAGSGTWEAEARAGERGVAIGAAAMIPAILVHSLFSNSLFLPYLMEPLWVLWALVFCIDAKDATGARERLSVSKT